MKYKGRTGLSASHQKIYARAWVNNEYIETPEIEISAVVDRIGTGDAYSAGFNLCFTAKPYR